MSELVGSISCARLLWKGRELYIEGVYCGEVARIIRAEWRLTTPPSSPLYDWYARNEALPWRAWLMTSADGDSVGTYATEDAAREALIEALPRAGIVYSITGAVESETAYPKIVERGDGSYSVQTHACEDRFIVTEAWARRAMDRFKDVLGPSVASQLRAAGARIQE